MDSIVTTAQGKLRGQVQPLPDGGTYISFKGIPYARPPLGKLRFKTMDSIVTTAQGKLRGQVQPLPDGGTYISFKGIPYARPPLGKLRFKAPSAPVAWNGVRDANKHGGICPQIDMLTGDILEGNEDCLYLNVYTKSLGPSVKPTPVMFWIHAGGFISGSGDADLYGPEYLLQHDVVVVTVNYRLEVLGFLCLENEDVPGNAGLKDQVAALKWVQMNISQFGGDPSNVTIFGDSAGGVSVTYHMVSPTTAHLFHKAIAQSGVFICDWAYSLRPRDRAFRLGKLLGKYTNDDKELLDFLTSVPAIDLVKVTFKTTTKDEKIRGLPIHFSPVFEKYSLNVDHYLSEKASDLLLCEKIKNVPFILGYNNAEGILVLRDTLKKIDFINKNLQCKVPREVFESVSQAKCDEFGERIRKFYFRGGNVSKDCTKELCDMESDLIFNYNCHRFADIYSKLSSHPVYMYRFTCDTDINLTKNISGITGIKGASHADDIFYLFRTQMFENIVKTDTRVNSMVYRLTKMWTDFAKTGNPTPDGALGVEWAPYNSGSRTLLDIGEELRLSQPDTDRLDLWKSIYSDAVRAIPKSNL